MSFLSKYETDYKTQIIYISLFIETMDYSHKSAALVSQDVLMEEHILSHPSPSFFLDSI
jgi:hypothetical protein